MLLNSSLAVVDYQGVWIESMAGNITAMGREWYMWSIVEY